MLALLALAPAVAYYDGPRGYCSPFTARYLTLIDDVLVFHGGQGYILKPKRGCLAEMSLPKHEDRHLVSYIKPFREESWLNDTLASRSLEIGTGRRPRCEKISLPVARPAGLWVAEARREDDAVRPARGGRHLLPEPGLLQQT